MQGERNVSPNSYVERSPRRFDAAIAALAERQRGVVSRTQLIELGLQRWEIEYRLQIGRLHAVHRAVYSVGHRILSRQARWMAAALAVGPDAVLSHTTAGAIWGLVPPAKPRIELTAPRRVRPPAGTKAHRTTLPPDEITTAQALPVTTVPRTLLDLAAVVTPRQVERALEQADRLRLDDPLSLDDLVRRYPTRRGTAIIRSILDAERLGTTFTRGDLEERFLAFVRASCLPSPELNAHIEVRPGNWIEADCVWRRRRVVVELDSRAYHATAQAFERDRARDRALAVAGWRTVRVTWRQLDAERKQLAGDLRWLLAA